MLAVQPCVVMVCRKGELVCTVGGEGGIHVCSCTNTCTITTATHAIRKSICLIPHNTAPTRLPCTHTRAHTHTSKQTTPNHLPQSLFLSHTHTHRCCLGLSPVHHPASKNTTPTRHHRGSCSSNTNSSSTPRMAKHSVHSVVAVSHPHSRRGRRKARAVGDHDARQVGGCSNRCCKRVWAMLSGVYAPG